MLTTLIQEVHSLVGSKADVETLEKKDHARLLVISDSHGHLSTFEKVLRQYGKFVDALIFCGDGSGDLAHILEESRSDAFLMNCLPPVIACVRGNCDASVYPVNKDFSLQVPNTQFLIVNGIGILVVHGHREGVDFGLENLGLEMQLSEAKTAFYGHTHVSREDYLNDYQIVNPGSIGRPRGGQPQCFAIATVEKTFVDMTFIRMERADDEKEFHTWQPIY